MGSRTWCSRAALAPSGDGGGCQHYCCVGMAKVGGRRKGMWGGKGFETSTAPLSFHLLQFIWCPVEFMILPPAKSCCISSHRVPSSRVIDQLACSLTTSKGIMSKAKLSPSNSFKKTDYLSFASGKTVSIHSKSPWWS